MALTKVSTDGVKDDAITKSKIPANQIEASELADNAVDTNAIADQAVALSKLPHGTSSNDGKFLRANNGADPTFETITGTTINNEADNRVLTATSTANTIQGEPNVTVGGQGDLHIKDPGNTAYTNFTGGTDAGIIIGNGLLDSAGVQLRTGTSGTCRLNFGDGDGTSSDRSRGFITYLHSSNNLTFGSNASERMRIDSSGNVGIGTTSPNYLLDIEAASDDAQIRLRTGGTGTGDDTIFRMQVAGTTQDNWIYFGDSTDSNAGQIRYNHQYDFMAFTTNATERIRLNSDGLYQANSANDTAYTLSIAGAIRFQFVHTGGGNMVISNPSTGNVTYSTSSDYRLKENVGSINNALNTVKALKPYQFTWKHDSKIGQGFFAHEVLETVPNSQAAIGTKDAVELEDDDKRGVKKGDPIYQGMDYAKLVPLLTAALQEEISKREALETRVAALEAA